MKLTVLKIKEEKSRQGGKCWLICFTSDLGTSLKTWVYEHYGNYTRNHWNDVISKGIGTVLDYGTLSLSQKNNLINADISFKILSEEVVNEATR